ncbi:hypothetical protein [Nonomuraea bangladeshensis]
MPRLPLLSWVAALAAAAYPTWDVHQAEYGAYYVRGCGGCSADTPT